MVVCVPMRIPCAVVTAFSVTPMSALNWGMPGSLRQMLIKIAAEGTFSVNPSLGTIGLNLTRRGAGTIQIPEVDVPVQYSQSVAQDSTNVIKVSNAVNGNSAYLKLDLAVVGTDIILTAENGDGTQQAISKINYSNIIPQTKKLITSGDISQFISRENNTVTINKDFDLECITAISSSNFVVSILSLHKITLKNCEIFNANVAITGFNNITSVGIINSSLGMNVSDNDQNKYTPVYTENIVLSDKTYVYRMYA